MIEIEAFDVFDALINTNKNRKYERKYEHKRTSILENKLSDKRNST